MNLWWSWKRNYISSPADERLKLLDPTTSHPYDFPKFHKEGIPIRPDAVKMNSHFKQQLEYYEKDENLSTSNWSTIAFETSLNIYMCVLDVKWVFKADWVLFSGSDVVWLITSLKH